MHWAYKIANELIEKYPNKETYVCASGISPSGSVHIGNFREVVTTYFVVKALNKLGKRTRFIFSWDDFDRFRKVPKNIDSSFEQHIGKSYSDIPDPFGCHASYAKHFENEFEQSLAEFGIEIEFIYQNKEYKSGRYNKEIVHAITKRKEIYDLLMKYKTNAANEKERNDFYPITVYCENCLKDDTKINQFDEQNNRIHYSCKCGFSNKLSVLSANNIKLNWKIDWAMRWMKEDVIFEPGGRDHSSETGSYNVSKDIAKHIFNFEAPHYAPYEFIGIKGDNKKMSSSSGNLITPNELLKIYLPEIILFMFAKYKPTSSFNVGLDEDVIKNYTEYERYKTSYLSQKLQNSDMKDSIEFALNKKEQVDLPKFHTVVSILPLVNFNVDLVKDVLAKTGEQYLYENVRIISKLAEYWITNYYPQKNIRVNEQKLTKYYESLDVKHKSWLKDFCALISSNENADRDQIMKEIYAICFNEDQKIMKSSQRQLFTMIYQLALNTSSGPPLPFLIQAVSVKRLISLLEFDH